VCFQRHLGEVESTAIRQSKPTACLDAPAFYDYLINRIFVTFTPKLTSPQQNFEVRKEGDEKFTVALSKKDNYDALAHKAAEQLSLVTTASIDPSHLRFTTANAQTGKPRTLVKRQAGTTVSTILFGTSGNYGGGYSYNSSAAAQAPDHLFYEVLEMTLTDLEQRKAIRVIWLSDGINKETAYEMAMPKQSLFSDVLAALQKRAGLPEEVVQHVRFYEAHGSKVYKVLPLTHSVVALNEYMTVYAERIPAEEEAEAEAERQGTMHDAEGEVGSDVEFEEEDARSGRSASRLVHCFHFEKEPSKPHGVPFLFLLKEGEAFTDTRERLSKRTWIKGKNLEKVRFAVVKGGQGFVGRPVWVQDGKCHLPHLSRVAGLY